MCFHSKSQVPRLLNSFMQSCLNRWLHLHISPPWLNLCMFSGSLGGMGNFVLTLWPLHSKNSWTVFMGLVRIWELFFIGRKRIHICPSRWKMLEKVRRQEKKVTENECLGFEEGYFRWRLNTENPQPHERYKCWSKLSSSRKREVELRDFTNGEKSHRKA